MSNTNDDTNMTGNADNCDPLRTKSGQGVSGSHASVEEIAKDIEERILPQAFKEWEDRSVVDEINMRVSANFAEAMRKATTPVEAQTGHGLTSMIELGLEPVPITKRPTPSPQQEPAPDLTYPLECQIEKQHELIDKLERHLAEVISQRDAAHQKCRDYRLVALGAEDALEKMTAQRDALVEELGKMLSAFNIMESSEERDVWESAHSVWFMMKGDTNSIDALVNRFLSWKLPESVRVDRIAYEPAGHFDRYGTNLLSASEAKQMIEHLLGVKIQIDESVPDDTVIVKGGEA